MKTVECAEEVKIIHISKSSDWKFTFGVKHDNCRQTEDDYKDRLDKGRALFVAVSKYALAPISKKYRILEPNFK